MWCLYFLLSFPERTRKCAGWRMNIARHHCFRVSFPSSHRLGRLTTIGLCVFLLFSILKKDKIPILNSVSLVIPNVFSLCERFVAGMWIQKLVRCQFTYSLPTFLSRIKMKTLQRRNRYGKFGHCVQPLLRNRILLSSSKNIKKNLDSYCFATSLWLLQRDFLDFFSMTLYLSFKKWC